MVVFFSFFSGQRTIALEFTETHMRVARGEQHGTILRLLSHAEMELPGEFREKGNVQELQNLIQTALKSAKETSARNVTLLLPPPWVYTCLIQDIPQDGNQGKLREEIAKIIPEDLGALTLQTRVLRNEIGKMAVGVAAIRRTTLKIIEDACMGTKLHFACVTTLPCVLASRLQKETVHDLLVVSAVGSSPPTVTLFHRGFPVDESVLASGSTEKDVAKELRALLEEYAKRDLFKEGTIAVYGSAALLQESHGIVGQSVKKECEKTEKKVAKVERGGNREEEKKEEKKQEKPVWSIVSAFPEASAAEFPWFGLAAASLCHPSNVLMNFAGSS